MIAQVVFFFFFCRTAETFVFVQESLLHPTRQVLGKGRWRSTTTGTQARRAIGTSRPARWRRATAGKAQRMTDPHGPAVRHSGNGSSGQGFSLARTLPPRARSSAGATLEHSRGDGASWGEHDGKPASTRLPR